MQLGSLAPIHIVLPTSELIDVYGPTILLGWLLQTLV